MKESLLIRLTKDILISKRFGLHKNKKLKAVVDDYDEVWVTPEGTEEQVKILSHEYEVCLDQE